MILHGLIADFHPLGDFLVFEALGDQGCDLSLTRVEGKAFRIAGRRGRVLQPRGKLPHYRGHGVGIQPYFSRMNFANALEKKLVAGLLQNDNAAGAQLHRLYKLGLVLCRGQYNDLGLRRGVAQLS
jgi:hypothetical protein